MTNAITILPESNDRTLCVEVSGVISSALFLENFIKPIRALIDKHGVYNVCAIYSDYQGWDSDAAEASFNYYIEVGAQALKMAFVNPPDSRMLLLKIMQPVLPNAEIRFFDTDEGDAAISWAIE